MCVCVCVFSSHSFWTSSSLDVPAGVTQEGHTGFLIHLSAVRALIFLARRYAEVHTTVFIYNCESGRSKDKSIIFLYLISYLILCLKKNLNAPRPSEHPPVRGGKCQNV